MDKENTLKAFGGKGWRNRLIQTNFNFRGSHCHMKCNGVEWSSCGRYSVQRSGRWCNGAGQGPLTTERDYRTAHVRGGNPSQTQKNRRKASLSNEEYLLYLRQSSKCLWWISRWWTETGILSWDTKRWLKQYWNIKIMQYWNINFSKKLCISFLGLL